SYGASAESGRTGGPGLVNNIIKSGTNKVKGTARVTTYRKAFNAVPYGSRDGNEPDGNTFAGGVGGPVRRDRLFYFASYEASKRAFPVSLGFRSEAARDNAARLGFTGDEIDVLPSTFNPQLWLLKLDWKPHAAHNVALRGNTFREFFAARDPGGTTVLSSSNGAIFNEGAVALGLTSALSPRIVNEFRTQIADRLTRRRPVVAPGPDTLPTTTVSGVATFGFPGGLTANREKIIEFSDNVSWTSGAHQVKTGFNIIESPLRFEDQLNASFTFGALTSNAQRPAVTALDNYLNARAGLIDPSTGRPYTYTQLSVAFGDPILTYSVRYYGVYAQDEWRLLPNVTLNYGLRWETVEPPTADQTSPHELSRQFRQDRNNFAPRLGFAWAPDSSSRTAVRGSYGLHFDAPQANYYRNVLQQNGQAQFNATVTGTAAGAPVYPNVPTSAAGLTTARSSISVMDPDFEWMRVHQAQVSVARALTEDTSLTATYAFTKADQIPVIINVNLSPPIGTLSDGRNLYNSTARLDARFNNINMVQAVGRSNYNGLGLNMNKRFGRGSRALLRGLQFNLAYTWSHALDDAPESGISGGSELPQDSFDRAADYGPALSDVRHVFNASAVFRPRARNALLDNNQISMILFARSGNVFDARAGTDLNRDSVNNDRPPFFGRNAFTGPSSVQLDMRYARFFRLAERYKAQLLIEAANLLNRPNPDGANAAVNRTYGTGAEPVASFGNVIRFREMRRVQLGLRFDF
ncbi:MAG TPA: TonB-dependent receptor, partial [Vicinamibacterales bacterium]|nr:TonB-dependent receptor [Vicinamibacterales bacterium]